MTQTSYAFLARRYASLRSNDRSSLVETRASPLIRLWNPVHGYFLIYFCYRPVARVVPRLAAVILTLPTWDFMLHDLPAWAFMSRVRVLTPGATITFMVRPRLRDG